MTEVHTPQQQVAILNCWDSPRFNNFICIFFSQVFINFEHKHCRLLAFQPKFEAILSEIDITTNELHYAITHLSSWMKPEYVGKNLVGRLLGCFSALNVLA